MYIVGLTGGPATGKSTVLSFFKDRGIGVVDADQIAREVIEPGKYSWNEIVREFGNEILLEDGKINRSLLGTIVFNDVEKRRKLNSITHPQIQRQLIKMAIKSFFEGHHFVVMELPLLFESGRMMMCMHKIITVICDDVQQLERLSQRDALSTDMAKKRINAQMPLEEKVAHSHFIVYNSGSLNETKQQTDNIIKTLRASKFHWYIRGSIAAATLTIPCIFCYWLIKTIWKY